MGVIRNCVIRIKNNPHCGPHLQTYSIVRRPLGNFLFCAGFRYAYTSHDPDGC
jgi:hypothetical protein